MKGQTWQVTRLALAVALAVCLIGCPTLSYRAVQDDFERAVRSEVSTDPDTIFTEPVGYQSVADTLTDEYIEKLDKRLHANAYMLRAYSYWRVGDLANARKSAGSGTNAGPRAGSRDDIQLKLMRSLVPFTEALKKRGNDRYISPATYDELLPKFEVAMSEWKKAKAAVNAQTPEGIVYYLHFQRWRMLQTWRSHFALSIDGNGDGAGTDADNDARKKALADAEAVLGGVSLRDAANQSRDAIPEGMVLHRQIKALGG